MRMQESLIYIITTLRDDDQCARRHYRSDRVASAMRARSGLRSAGTGAAADDIAGGSRKIFLPRGRSNSQCTGRDRSVAAVAGPRASAPAAGYALESSGAGGDRGPADSSGRISEAQRVWVP